MKLPCLALLSFFVLCAGEVFAADRVRIGYSSISGAYTPIWVAHDAGYIVKEGLQGADLKIIGNAGNKMVFSLFVRPEIKSVEQLKGKKIGVTRFGSAPDISVRYALRRYNINPDKDL